MLYKRDPNSTNGEHEILEDAAAPEPGTWWQGPASLWPKSSLTTTSLEQVQRQAQLQQEQQEDKLDELPPLDDVNSASDAAPLVVSFFNGKSYAEGRAAYNQYRVSRGLPPVPEGQR